MKDAGSKLKKQTKAVAATDTATFMIGWMLANKRNSSARGFPCFIYSTWSGAEHSLASVCMCVKFRTTSMFLLFAFPNKTDSGFPSSKSPLCVCVCLVVAERVSGFGALYTHTYNKEASLLRV